MGFFTSLGSVMPIATMVGGGYAAEKEQQNVRETNAASAYESAVGRDFAKEQQQREFDYNMVEAQKARDFSERMSSTAVQRRMDDMRTAGINPILAVDKGAGAPQPSAPVASGSSSASGIASFHKGNVGNIWSTLLSALTSNASQFAKLGSEIQKNMSEVERNRALAKEKGAKYPGQEFTGRMIKKIGELAEGGYSAYGKFFDWIMDKVGSGLSGLLRDRQKIKNLDLFRDKK